MPFALILQHEADEGPGLLAAALDAAGIELRLVRVYAGEPVPAGPGEACALVALGGSASAVPPHLLPWLAAEIALLGQAAKSGLAVLGLCLGSQLLATALGGTVARASRKEIGFLRVRLSPAAAADALLSALPANSVAFHWHEDAITAPPGATVLASSTLTPVQAFRSGSLVWGIQFHPEADLAVVQAMAHSGASELESAGVDPDRLIEAAHRELPRTEQARRELFARFAGLARERRG